MFDDLALLSHCDNLGRYTSSPSFERQIDVQKVSEILKIQEKEKNMNFPTLELLVGVSNSGKTTYTEQKIEEGFMGEVISRDALVMKYGRGETYNACWESLSSKQQDEINEELDKQFLDAVENNKSIIVDMMNLSRRSRKLWLEKTPVHYHKKATLFLTPYSEILHRNESQKEFKYLNQEILDGMVKRFEYPLYDEIDELKHIEINTLDHGQK
jgi:predicted kinase